MGTFKVKSKSVNAQYEYKDENVFVAGSYNADATTNQVKGISGNVYLLDASGNQGQSIGNFNGHPDRQSGDFIYSLSEMTKEQSDLTWAAIEEIEKEITKEN